ncbi:MAG: DNA (cytosine-5-)-methyltransferase [Ruminococcus sp.]|nr:DNA (cytosine-5-)-methyltransferase [Ruminococcus sp.]
MKFVDLFCGCGGMSLGFIKAGFKLSGGFENWDYAINCFNANLNNRGHKMDLSDVSLAVEEIKKLKPELIIGGPPCQDFSVAGNQVEGERADLTYSFAEIIAKCMPKYFVMENVKQVVDSAVYLRAKHLLKKSGYGLTEKVLDASYCCVPQKRKRFFCVGAINQPDDFLEEMLSGNQSVFPMTIREYMDSQNIELDFDYYYRHPRTYARRAIFSVDEPSPTIRGVNRPKPANYKKHPKDPVDPENTRALTCTERACIQTFPIEYNWIGNDSVVDQMIGNAVPVNLAYYIAYNLRNFDKGKIDNHILSFVGWLQNEKHIKRRAAGDVVSRALRAKRILAFSNYKKNNYLKKLSETDDYQRLNKTVQAQVKRAVSLYFEYRQKG